MVGSWNVEAPLSWQLYPTLCVKPLNEPLPLNTSKACHKIKVPYWCNAESGRLLVESPKFMYFYVGYSIPNRAVVLTPSQEMQWRFLFNK